MITLRKGEKKHARDRAIMVARHLRSRGIDDPVVLAALGAVPREAFVPEHLQEFAYEDTPLPIEAGQTISQPYIVARMIALAEVKAGDKVLEVGAGSGYAAAVLGRIARRVYAIERNSELAARARARLKRLSYSNVEIICGDGTNGLPEQAPFDAIIVSAGAPAVPETLKRELALGGRLIIPVGPAKYQKLIRVRRKGEEDGFQKEDFGFVTFVPLIGRQGWSEKSEPRPPEIDAEETGVAAGPLISERRAKSIEASVSRAIAEAAEPFDDLDALSRLVRRFADRRVVLLGEATHGSAEFYSARSAITSRLVQEHGFNIVAVEADWPDAAIYDAYVRVLPRPTTPKHAFTRFPTWMWRNCEVASLLHQLKEINGRITEPARKCGFYGLDIYSLNASIDAVLEYLDRVDPEMARTARERYGCLTPFRADPARYGRMALSQGFAICEKPVTEALISLLRKRLDYLAYDGEAFFDAEQNARIAAAAEEYYRAIYYGDALSWNLRDEHMFETLQRLLKHRGPDSKAIVWAHNSHVGNAEFTEMGQVRGEHNIGQLARKHFGEEAAMIGFGTDRGTVAAASNWDGPMEIKQVRAARRGSYEGGCRESGIAAFFLELGSGQKPEIRDALAEPLLERAIGVIYRPEAELLSHYFQAELSRQFDAWIWFEETHAISARPDAHPHGPDDTYPFGL
jgi:protein-L-isoaspartate(D-aspartate) O-methyltransferase